VRADVSRRRAPVPERNRHRELRLPGLNERRQLEPRRLPLDGADIPVAYAGALRQRWSDGGVVAPRHLADGIGQLLQPWIAGVAAVTNGDPLVDVALERVRPRGPARRR